jgi:DNA-binding CsgD family transcriptional regulator
VEKDDGLSQAGGECTEEEILAEITQELTRTRLDVHTILTMVTGSLSRRRPGTWVATVLNKDPSTSLVRVADDSNAALADYIAGYIATLDRPGRSLTSGLSRTVIDSGRPVLWPNVPMEQLLAHMTPVGLVYREHHPPPVEYDVLGALMVPMHAGEKIVGALAVFDWGAKQLLDENYQCWVQLLADRVGLAVEHAQLQTAAVERLERLTALRNVALAIASSDDLRLTIEVILGQVTSRLKVDAADVLLVDESDNELYAGAFTGFHSASIPNYRFPIDSDLRDFALMRREPILHDLDRVDHGQRRSLFAREGFQYYLATPLVARNKLRGVLEVFDRTALEPDQEWTIFLDTIATNAAIAIDRTAVQDQVERSRPAAPRSTTPAPELSRLERWILALLVEGATNQEIAEKVHLSQNTVKFHVRRILQKAGAANRTELARIATREDWL